MIGGIIAGTIAGVIMTGAGLVLVHIAMGVFGLCSRLGRVIDRTPDLILVPVCLAVVPLGMAALLYLLAHG